MIYDYKKVHYAVFNVDEKYLEKSEICVQKVGILDIIPLHLSVVLRFFAVDNKQLYFKADLIDQVL